MNTAVLERGRITVQYINERRGNQKSASIKDVDGIIYWVKPEDLHQFAPGASYDAEWSISQSNGYTNRNMQRAVRVQQQRQQGQPRAQTQNTQQDVRRSAPVEYGGNGNGHSRGPTHPIDAQRMFVCSILNAFIGTGRIDNDVTALTDAVNKLRQVWADTFGQEDAAG